VSRTAPRLPASPAAKRWTLQYGRRTAPDLRSILLSKLTTCRYNQYVIWLGDLDSNQDYRSQSRFPGPMVSADSAPLTPTRLLRLSKNTTRLLRLSKNLPHDWKEQRCFLGFAA
jgi:hypothetical protein